MADNKLVGLEVASRLTARAVEDLAEEIEEQGDRLELAVGRAEASAEAAKAEIGALRAEVVALTVELRSVVSLVKELESRSLPSRIVAWAEANPIQLVLLVGMLLLFQSGYAYLIPHILPGAAHDEFPHPPAVHAPGDLAPAAPPAILPAVVPGEESGVPGEE